MNHAKPSQRVHREVMGWLKEWDKCVFKRANPPKKRRMADGDEQFIVDPLGRPREKASASVSRRSESLLY